jgi:hypothetical protein
MHQTSIVVRVSVVFLGLGASLVQGDGGESASQPAVPDSAAVAAPEAIDVVGQYYFGDGLGVNCRLMLTRGRFTFKWTGCMGTYDENEGTWKTSDDGLIVLSPAKPNVREGFKGTATRLYPVLWGQRLYLVAQDQMIDFCRCLSLDWVFKGPRHDGCSAFFYLRTGDESKPFEGAPAVPAVYGKYLNQPFSGSVTRVNANGSFVVDRGARDGVVVGTKFKIVGGDRFGYEVVEVGNDTAKCVARGTMARRDLVKSGAQVCPFMGDCPTGK